MKRKNLFDLSSRVALVTGANSGLGFGFAEGIAQCGGDIVVWGRREHANAEAAEKLAEYGVRVHHQSVDVADEAAVRAGFAAAVAAMGRIDCVIANAGMLSDTVPYHERTTESWHRLLAVNLHGAHFTLQEAVRHMLSRAEAGDPGGSLLICGSLTTAYGVPGIQHYAAAKGALGVVSKCIAVEYGRAGIRCNVVLPGFILTGGKTKEDEADEPLTEMLRERTPIPRWGYPEDFGGLAAYLMSDAASFHTGDFITIDGGWTAGVF
jgi:NAD(P)-dependent dehydrogenase (short-subunit alcohol dehydrogenase family)